MTTTTNAPADTTADPLAVMERALLTENLGSAIILEDAHLSAGEDIASAARKALRYDTNRAAFVSRDTGEPVPVRDWLRGQREDRGHWFKAAPATPAADQPTERSKPAGFTPDAQRPQPPGQPATQTAAPVGRVVQQMSEHEYAAYKKQNRYARVVSASNVGGQRVFTVDCGGQASAQQVGGQTLDEYRAWREAQGMGQKASVA